MREFRLFWSSVFLTCFFFAQSKSEHVLYTRVSNETSYLRDLNYNITIEIGNNNMRKSVADAAAETMKVACLLHSDVASRLTYFRVNFHKQYPRYNWNTFENCGTYGFYTDYYVILKVTKNSQDPDEYLIFSVTV